MLSTIDTSSSSEEVVTGVQLLYPVDGSITKTPIFVQFDTEITSAERFKTQFDRTKACMELDRATPNATYCYPMLDAQTPLEYVRPGSHSLRIVVIEVKERGGNGRDSNVAVDKHEMGSKSRANHEKDATEMRVLMSELAPFITVLRVSDEIHFTVLDNKDFDRYQHEQLQRQRQRYQLPPPEHDDIVEWMRRVQDTRGAARYQEQATDQLHVAGAVDALGEFSRLDHGDAGVVDLAHQQRQHQHYQQLQQNKTQQQQQPLIVVGVKTSPTHGFAQRQGIRDTWASERALHPAVRVFFLGCRPMIHSSHKGYDDGDDDGDDDDDDRDEGDADAEQREKRQRRRYARVLELAIETEKRVFGADLLTHELDCDDSYFTLTDKVKHFMHFATTAFPSAAYVMIIDDDAYVRTHELVEMISRDEWPRRRLYIGHVVTDRFSHIRNPARDPGHKNYLPHEQYPLSDLPPFAFGCHFLLSADCAQFIGRNRHRLQGLAGLDDVSVALWMLTIQVHPTHTEHFKNLDVSPCKDSFVSFADLSSSAMRIAHANLAAGRPFCSDFDRNTWRKAPLDSTPTAQGGVLLAVVVQRTHDNSRTQVFANITSLLGDVKYTFSFLPSTQLLDELTPELCLRVKQRVVPAGFACEVFSLGLRSFMLELARNESRADNLDSAHLQLWMHNLQLVGVHAPITTVVLSVGTAPIRSMLECIFTTVFPRNRIKVFDEEAFAAQKSGSEPDIVVFSALDGLDTSCRFGWEPRCKHVAASFMRRYGGAASLIMVASGPWNVDELDPSVLLISTTSNVTRANHVYIPVASVSFSERVNQSPMLLLSSSAERHRRLRLQSSSQSPSTSASTSPTPLPSSSLAPPTSSSSWSPAPTPSVSQSSISPSPLSMPPPPPRKFCAYLYARCDRPQREYMFDLLNAMEPVDALGVCQGSVRGPNHDRVSARRNPLYNEDAVRIYEQYKFVIAFENAQHSPGYVTEKLVNAFLAGSIPVYLGHSDSTAQLFNPHSFIDCGRFATLRKCAERVMEVHRSDELYESMLREPAVGNVTRFFELFSWHPDVPSDHIAVQIAGLLLRNFRERR